MPVPPSFNRRQLLRHAGQAGLLLTAVNTIGWNQAAPLAATADDPLTAPPTGPRKTRLDDDTTDTLRMFLYNFTGAVGDRFSVELLRTTADVYDVVLWAYAGTGVAETLHEFRPDFTVTQYFDFIWAGWHGRDPDGIDWMPGEGSYEYVDSIETMFSHSVTSPFPKQRLANPFFPSAPYGAQHDGPDLWMTNALDFDPDQPERMDKWVNYFANHSRNVINAGDMDGLCIDELMHPYSPIFPDGYDEAEWTEALRRTAMFTRRQLGPDKLILFNGIQLDAVAGPRGTLTNPDGTLQPEALEFLEWTDGALIEFFSTQYLGAPLGVEQWPQPLWENTLDICLEIEGRGKVLFCQSNRGYDNRDLRMLSLASFYLAKGRRSYYLNGGIAPRWYGEWGVRLGAPTFTGERATDYLIVPSGDLGDVAATGTVYARPYELGIAIANPSAEPAVVELGRTGYRAVGSGGGTIEADGRLPEADVTYEEVTRLQMPAFSGDLILWEPQAAGTHHPQRPGYGSSRANPPSQPTTSAPRPAPSRPLPATGASPAGLIAGAAAITAAHRLGRLPQ